MADDQEFESMDNREEKFLEYNKDNIMMNLQQIEQHLRDIDREDLGDHSQCITKHSLMVQGELDEAISHASAASPRDVEYYKILKENVIDLRENLGNRTVEENLRLVREIRKGMETTDPEKYDTSQCKACGPISQIKADEEDDNEVDDEEDDEDDVDPIESLPDLEEIEDELDDRVDEVMDRLESPRPLNVKRDIKPIVQIPFNPLPKPPEQIRRIFDPLGFME